MQRARCGRDGNLLLVSESAALRQAMGSALAALNVGISRRNGVVIGPAEPDDPFAVPRIEARYQPIVRVADRQPVAVETLARLHDPEQGPLPPSMFVPQIEEAGLSPRLTETITALALADFTGLHLGGCGLQLTLNMPLDVVLSDTALDRLERQRQAAGVAADAVVIELTESRPVENLAPLVRAVERLRRAGYGVSIDDIGPTVRNWAALVALPFTAVKLDKGVVQASAEDAGALGFVRRAIGAARSEGLTVIAEGVETAGLWGHMRELGVDQAQGFLVARPLPAAAVPLWLEAWREQAPHRRAPLC